MSNVYEWQKGTRARVDAQTAGEELERLREQYDGVIAPDSVVDAARAAESPLHAAFTWDDSQAAHLHRLSEARYMMRSLIIVYAKPENQEDHRVRAYQNLVVTKAEPTAEPGNRFALTVPTDDDGPNETRQAYVHIIDAMQDKNLRDQILQKALAEITSWRRRYAEYREFAEIFASIDRAQPSLNI